MNNVECLNHWVWVYYYKYTTEFVPSHSWTVEILKILIWNCLTSFFKTNKHWQRSGPNMSRKSGSCLQSFLGIFMHTPHLGLHLSSIYSVTFCHAHPRHKRLDSIIWETVPMSYPGTIVLVGQSKPVISCQVFSMEAFSGLYNSNSLYLIGRTKVGLL